MEPRFFTVEEANRELPRIKRKFDRLFYLNNSVKDASKDIQELVNIWGEEIFETKNVDHRLYMERIDKRAKLIDDVQVCVEEIGNNGCIVKDVDIGLVDFFHRRGEEIVFLCWRYGEDRINHWHPVNAGFANRRPLKDLVSAI